MQEEQLARSTDTMLDRAKLLIANVRHAAMATVNEDGSPHNTPYFFIPSGDLATMYWISDALALHSKNVERTGQVFITLYDAHERGGVYIKCDNARVASEEEADESLKAQNLRRALHDQDELPEGFYNDQAHLATYRADAVEFWYYDREKDERGHTKKDIRKSVSREDLL